MSLSLSVHTTRYWCHAAALQVLRFFVVRLLTRSGCERDNTCLDLRRSSMRVQRLAWFMNMSVPSCPSCRRKALAHHMSSLSRVFYSSIKYLCTFLSGLYPFTIDVHCATSSAALQLHVNACFSQMSVICQE